MQSDDIRSVAIHEAGHALVGTLVDGIEVTGIRLMRKGRSSNRNETWEGRADRKCLDGVSFHSYAQMGLAGAICDCRFSGARETHPCESDNFLPVLQRIRISPTSLPTILTGIRVAQGGAADGTIEVPIMFSEGHSAKVCFDACVCDLALILNKYPDAKEDRLLAAIDAADTLLSEGSNWDAVLSIMHALLKKVYGSENRTLEFSQAELHKAIQDSRW